MREGVNTTVLDLADKSVPKTQQPKETLNEAVNLLPNSTVNTDTDLVCVSNEEPLLTSCDVHGHYYSMARVHNV